MKRILALVMLLCLLVPACAMAEQYNLWIAGTTVTTDNQNDVFSNGTVQFIPGESSNTLRLKNANIEGSIFCSEDKPLILEIEGENQVAMTAQPGYELIAIQIGSPLTIRETTNGGSLNVSATRTEASDQGNCVGIKVPSGYKLRIESGDITIKVVGKGRSVYAGAIFTAGDIEIAGGNVKTYINHDGKNENQAGWADNCAGIYTEGNNCTITISGKYTVVETYSGKASVDNSCGIGVGSDSNIVIEDATVKAFGGTAAYSYGLGSDNKLIIKGNANVTAEGGKGENWSEPETEGYAPRGNSYGIGSKGTLTIEGSATVNAKGGNAVDNSYGLGCDNDVSIKGSANVTAKGGTARVVASMGIGAGREDNDAGNLNISGSAKVTAEGGSAPVSYGVGLKGGLEVADDASLTAKGGNGTTSSIGAGVESKMKIGKNAVLDAAGSSFAVGVQSNTVELDNAHFLMLKDRSDNTLGKPSIDWAHDENLNYIYMKIYAAYTVSFDANGGEGKMPSIMVESGQYYLPECGFTAPEGQDFAGWLVKNQKYQPGDSLTVTEEMTIQALWKNKEAEEKPKVIISFDKGTGEGEMKPVELDEGAIYTLPPCGFAAPEGHVFGAWSVNDEKYWPGDSLTVTADMTIQALWANDGAIVPGAPEKEPEPGEAQEMPDMPQTGDPSSLLGWAMLLGASAAGMKLRRKK